MIDLNMKLNLSDSDFETIKQIIDALKPVKEVVKTICKRNTNLICTDAALNLVFTHLAKQDNAISTSLYIQLTSRVKERRMVLSDVLTYLHTGKTTSFIQSSLNTEPIENARICGWISKIVNDLGLKNQIKTF